MCFNEDSKCVLNKMILKSDKHTAESACRLGEVICITSISCYLPVCCVNIY